MTSGMKPAVLLAHTTANELAFVNNLATYSKVGPTLRRPLLLRKYLDAMSLRKNWGAVDPLIVRGRVLELLDARAKAA